MEKSYDKNIYKLFFEKIQEGSTIAVPDEVVLMMINIGKNIVILNSTSERRNTDIYYKFIDKTKTIFYKNTNLVIDCNDLSFILFEHRKRHLTLPFDKYRNNIISYKYFCSVNLYSFNHILTVSTIKEPLVYKGVMEEQVFYKFTPVRETSFKVEADKVVSNDSEKNTEKNFPKKKKHTKKPSKKVYKIKGEGVEYKKIVEKFNETKEEILEETQKFPTLKSRILPPKDEEISDHFGSLRKTNFFKNPVFDLLPSHDNFPEEVKTYPRDEELEKMTPYTWRNRYSICKVIDNFTKKVFSPREIAKNDTRFEILYRPVVKNVDIRFVIFYECTGNICYLKVNENVQKMEYICKYFFSKGIYDTFVVFNNNFEHYIQSNVDKLRYIFTRPI